MSWAIKIHANKIFKWILKHIIDEKLKYIVKV